MSDLEITRLCAEAMGYDNFSGEDTGRFGCRIGITWTPYNPLNNDAQAMALVKEFYLTCGWDTAEPHEYYCQSFGPVAVCIYASDLNRAIAMCVAKMTEAKNG